MGKKKRSVLRWPGTPEDNARLEAFRDKNRFKAAHNPNERWMAAKLEKTGYKWTTQARWGYRMFDFWCPPIGIAVEVDGPDHDQAYDAYRDRDAAKAYGIVVLRVRNMNEHDARQAIEFIMNAESWNDRLERMGLPTRWDGKLAVKAEDRRKEVLAGRLHLPIRWRQHPSKTQKEDPPGYLAIAMDLAEATQETLEELSDISHDPSVVVAMDAAALVVSILQREVLRLIPQAVEVAARVAPAGPQVR